LESETLLTEISGFCRRVGMAESTFGRLAVNDGKLVSRLRFGGRVRDKTVERVRAFIDREKQGGGAVGVIACQVWLCRFWQRRCRAPRPPRWRRSRGWRRR
jgi:hypothetical protein